MGTWGPGVYQNDYALDLLSGEVMNLIDELEKTHAIEPLSYDDLEGPLVYVHLLSLIAQEKPGTSSTQQIHCGGMEANASW